MLLRAAVLSLVVATTLVPATSFAAPNTNKYQKSIEGTRHQQREILCNNLKKDLATAEAEADKRAETPAAQKWSDMADGIWEMGEQKGCSWTK
ncbi:MAG: hypothetical protein ACO1OG_05325 [Devosia sp.]